MYCAIVLAQARVRTKNLDLLLQRASAAGQFFACAIEVMDVAWRGVVEAMWCAWCWRQSSWNGLCYVFVFFCWQYRCFCVACFHQDGVFLFCSKSCVVIVFVIVSMKVVCVVRFVRQNGELLCNIFSTKVVCVV